MDESDGAWRIAECPVCGAVGRAYSKNGRWWRGMHQAEPYGPPCAGTGAALTKEDMR